MNGLRKAAVTVAVASGVALALGGGAAAQTLVAHWEFEDGTDLIASDSVGTNDGDLIDMPGDATNWVEGKVGSYALQFDGANDKVDVPYTAELNPNQFSFALWVKPDGGTYYRSPLMCRNDPPQSGYNLYETPNNDWSFWIGNGTNWSTCGGATVRDGEWQHIACTYDGTTMTMYVDGTDVGSNSPVTLVINPSSLLRIGAGGTPWSGDLFFPGLIDDVRFYDGAIDAAAVQALYDMGKPMVMKAVAGDPDEGDAVLGPGDEIYVWFDMDTNLSMDDETKTGEEMDDLFPLSGGHSWGTAAAARYDLDWADPNVLRITVTNTTGATIDIGDTIAVDASADIRNSAGTQTATGTVTLGGDWGTGSGVPAAVGGILVELWLPQVAGNDQSVRTSSNPPLPSLADYSTTCEGYQNYGSNYNTRLRGYLYPPEEGDYLFHLAADDVGELWLSYDDNPANMRLIVEVNSPTNFDFSNAVESGPVYLEAGMRYYVEAVHREGGGSDHVRVGWTGPSALDEKPIDGSHLSPAYLEPALRAIVADDPDDGDAARGVDDTITISFHQSTNRGLAELGYSGDDMDTYFPLGGGHTWGTAATACTVSWNDDWTLQIQVNNITDATIDIGDTVTVKAAANIKDELGLMPAWSLSGMLAGNWGLSGVTGLVAHWRLDETFGTVAQDSVGANHGTKVGDPVMGSTGKVEKAFRFDGVDDYVAVPSSADLNPTAAITVAAWVCPEIWSDSNRRILQKSWGQYRLRTEWDSGADARLLKFYIRDDVDVDHLVSAASLPPAGEWHHVAGTYDGTDLKIYVDGVEEGTLGAPGLAIRTSGDPLYIGTSESGASAGDHMKGLIDDVRIYNIALDLTGVQQLYQAGAALIMSAFAEDSDNGDNVLGVDDIITLTFDPDMYQAMSGQTFDGDAMDARFDLSADHVWGGAGASYSLSWTDLRTLVITINALGTTDIAIGDTMTTTATANLQIAGGGPAQIITSPPLGGDWGRMPWESLAGHWKFDDYPGSGTELTAADSSGNGNHGALVNMPGDATNWVAGRVGAGALDFDGSDDRVDLGNPPALQITGSQTICMWLRPDVLDKRQNPYAKAYGGEGTITVEPSGSVNYYYGTAGRNDEPYQTFTMTSPLSVGTWTHLVIVRDLVAMKLRWYKDRVLAGEADALHASATASSLTAYIGDGYTENFDGLIDDVRIYNVPLPESYIDTILANSTVSIWATDPSARENAALPDTGTFVVSREGSSLPELTVKIGVGGTADDPQQSAPDYDLSVDGAEATISYYGGAGTWILTILTDAESATITVTPTNDDEPEPPETVILTVLPGDPYSVDSDNYDATVDIVDDDAPGPFAIESPPSVADGATEVDNTTDIRLEWTAPTWPLAGGYTLTVALDAGFTSLVVGPVTQTDTFYVIAGGTLGTDEHVYWTVVASNVAGTTEISDAPLGFFTPDTIGPWVTRSDPEDLEADVDTSSDIRVYFNERMAKIATEWAAEILGPDGQIVPGAWSLDASGTVLIFKPDDGLEVESTYDVTIAATAADFVDNLLDCDRDLDGGELLEDGHAFSFTTWEALRGLADGEGCVPGSGLAGAWLAVALAALALKGPGRRRHG